MPKRICGYKHCTSVQGSSTTSSNEVFFSFPTDSMRQKLWKHLSQCEDDAKYLCSKHFDKTKYISKNPRRTILLQSAVPYPYDENSTEEYIDFLLKNQEDDSEESPISLPEEANDSTEEITLENGSIIKIDDDNVYTIATGDEPLVTSSPSPTKAVKRKICIKQNKNLVLHSVKKYPKVEKHTAKCEKKENDKTIDMEKTNAEDIEDKDGSLKTHVIEKIETVKVKSPASNEPILDPNITTFIFKGEEYVQMPKAFYDKQKLDLLNEIQHYKSIVRKIKMLIKDEIDLK